MEHLVPVFHAEPIPIRVSPLNRLLPAPDAGSSAHEYLLQGADMVLVLWYADYVP